MKMKLALILLLFLGVGVLARSQTLNNARAEIAANELSERYTRSASGESAEVAAGGTDDQGAASVLQHLASILGLNVSKITDLVADYYTGNLSVLIETLLKAIGITTSLQEMQDTSPLLQLMKSIPIVGIIVSFLTNTLSVPINIIAVVFSLVTTIVQHIPNLVSGIL